MSTDSDNNPRVGAAPAYALVDASRAAMPPPYEQVLGSLAANKAAPAATAASDGKYALLSGAAAVTGHAASGSGESVTGVPRPNWLSAKRAARAMPKFVEALVAAAANGGAVACIMCNKTSTSANKLGEFNWCAKCVKDLTRCFKCDGDSYFTDTDELVQGQSWSYRSMVHGCIVCNWRKLELECVKCKRQHCGTGSVNEGVFTCYDCRHPPRAPPNNFLDDWSPN